MDEWYLEILDRGEVIALEESPCVRRRYCAQILLGGKKGWIGVNARFSDCCDNGCIREKSNALHGQMVERVAEVHAETMAIINFRIPQVLPDEATFYLSGVDTRTEKSLVGKNVYPCHTCALNIKAAGFSRVMMKDENHTPSFVPIDQIIKEREAEWEGMIL